MRAVQDTGYTQRLGYGVNGTPEGTTWTPMIYSPVHRCQGGLTGGT